MTKKRDGFDGEKLISLPASVWKNAGSKNSFFSQLYITHIGYFPKAASHYRERKKGCEDNILIYCLYGKGWYVIDDKRYEVLPNQFIVLPATKKYIRYGADEQDPWTIYWVHFSGKDMDMFNRSFSIDIADGPTNIPFNEKGLKLWDEMYQWLEMGYSLENLLYTNLTLYNFIATFLFPDKSIRLRKEEVSKDMVTRAILFMRENLDKKLTVEDIALHSNISASHFSLLFRKSTGMPPIDYYIQLKVQKACQQLDLTDNRIKEVADSVGYEDPYYFSRIFKKYIGQSPVQYRMSKKG